MAAAVPTAASWTRLCWLVVAVAIAGLFLLPARAQAARGGLDRGNAGGLTARQRVDLVVGLRWRDQGQLEHLLRDLSDPDSPQFGRYLSAAEFDARFGPSAATIEATRLVLRDHGLGVVDVSPSGLFLTASGWVTDVTATRNALLNSLRDLTQEVRLYFYLQVPGADGSGGGAAGDADIALRPPLQLMTLNPRASETAFTPATIARAYGFDTLYARGMDGRQTRDSTIAIATAYGFDPADLRAFWADSGIQRDHQEIELIWVGGETETMHIETTVDVQWTSALAPESPVIVYAAPEPSTHGFLKVYDRIITDNRAAVMVTSWGACERLLSLTYLEQAHILFQRAAAQGITVIAASGDRGADDCADGDQSVDFPASDPNVLAVGGTTLRNDGFYVREEAWSGSGGGTSAVWPAPPWQSGSRNRVLADVAFQADPRPGFTTRFEGRPLVVGGTSLAAPAWAAVMSLANEARTNVGGEPVGVAAPALCEAALAPSPSPFRDILQGDNGGFWATSGWDFPTGWGSPRVPALIEAVAQPAAAGLTAASSRGGIVLTPARDDAGGLRAQFLDRCGRSALRMQGRGLLPSDYVVAFNGVPVTSFSVDATGRTTLTIPGLDPRGGVISVTRAGAQIVFGGYFPTEGETSTRVAVELASTGLFDGASGLALYQRRHGRERFTVRVRNLSPGVYDLRLGSVRLAPLTVPSGSSTARVSFNVLGASSSSTHTPVCDSISILRDGLTVLHAGRSARSRDLCP